MHDTNDSNQHWEEWLETSAARFLLFARQQTRSEADAEDILQDVLVETWKKCGGMVPPDVLVYATIRRRAIDRARQNDARMRRETRDSDMSDWWEAPNIEQKIERDALLKAVRELHENQQEVVFLRIWGGLTFREISEQLCTPLQTISSRYNVAINSLKFNLEE